MFLFAVPEYRYHESSLKSIMSAQGHQEIEKIISQKIVERYNALTSYKAGDKVPKGQITKNLLKSLKIIEIR